MKPLVVTILLSVFALAGRAQVAGDTWITSGTPFGAGLLMRVGVGGDVTTLISLPSTALLREPIPAPDNRGVWVFLETQRPSSDAILHVDRSGATTIRKNWIGAPGPVFSARIDDAGDLVALVGSEIYTVAGPNGAVVLRHRLPLTRLWSGMTITEDPDTGDTLIFNPSFQSTSAAPLYRVRADSSFSMTSLRYPPDPWGSVGVARDPIDGTFLVGSGATLSRVDVRMNTVTSLHTGGGRATLDVAFDPTQGDWIVGRDYALLQFDRAGQLRSTLATLTSTPTEITVHGSRELGGLDPPRIGSRYRLSLSMPLEAGRGYAVGVSTGFRTGIRIGAHVVPLDPSPLLAYALGPNPVFAGFTGVLDATGRATPTVQLPNDRRLVGRRFYFAALTLDARGIRRVTAFLGVTIR